MAGVKQFDRAVVLDRAARAFWRAGFEATSIQDLEIATGLGRGSLYNAFGDKQSLFLAALDHYAVTEASEALRPMEAADVRAGLERTLRATIARMDDLNRPRGCLITNTCTGDGGGLAEARIKSSVRAMEAGFEAAFIRAIQSGHLDPSADPARLARFYCAVMQGIAVLQRASADRAALDDVVACALQAWPGKGSARG